MSTLWVFQHLAAEPPALLETVPRDLGHEVVTHRSDQGELPSALTPACDGLIVMGGPMSVYEPAGHPWIPREIDLIAAALAAGLPILGICLGCQLLAAAAGARVHAGAARPEIGWGRVTLTPEGARDPLCRPLADDPAGLDATVFQWHGDTFDLPPGATVLASNGAYAHQAFRLGSAYGFQFHFEVSAAIIRDWVALLPEPIAAAGLGSGQILRETERHIAGLSRRGAATAAAFARLFASPREAVPA